MARLGIDGTSIAPQGKGIARVQQKLAESLAATGRHDIVVFVRTPEAAAALPSVESRVVGDGLAFVWEQVGMRRALREMDMLLTFSDRLPVGAERRLAVWLFESPTHRIAENRRRHAGAYQRASDTLTSVLWRRSLARAGSLVAASQATARELGRDLPVIYPGLDEAFSPGHGREGRYVFHLASADPRDNTETVLAAFARVRTDAELIVGGGLGARTDELRARAGDRVRFLGRVSDEELLALYRGAAVHVDVPLYEGFGLQVAEAMACGTPVVGSDRSSLPEVIGDAGILCDALDVDGIAAAIQRVLDDRPLAEELGRRGIEQASQFTWPRAAAAFADVIDDVLP